MKQNVGTADRVIRAVAGVVFAIAAVIFKCWFCGVVALILLFTAALGWCGLYKIFGINTCKIKKQ